MPANETQSGLTVQNAINNVNNVARAYKGSADEHDILRQSIELLSNTLNENLKEMEGLAIEIEGREEQIRSLQAELATLAPATESEPAQEVPPGIAPRAAVRLEGTPRIRPAQRAGA